MTDVRGARPLWQIVRSACERNNVNQLWMYVKLEGETSFMSRRDPAGVGWRAPMGYGCPDGGGINAQWRGVVENIEGAVKWWGEARWGRNGNMDAATDFPRRRYINVAPEGAQPVSEWVDPRTRLEGSCFRYTPHLYSLLDHMALTRRIFPQAWEGWTMTGKSSVHPNTWARLQKAGVKSNQITQGIGSATASAGTHESVGTYDGRPFGHCIDLSWSLATRKVFDDLCSVGIIMFARDWHGNKHCHCVDATALPDDNGKTPRPHRIVVGQIEDFIQDPPLNGLRDHARLPARWAPKEDQRESIADLWRNHRLLGDEAPGWVLVGLDGKPIEDVPFIIRDGQAFIHASGLLGKLAINTSQLADDVRAVRPTITYKQLSRGHRLYLGVEKIT